MYIETMTLQEMKKKKKELHLTNEKIAELSGVPLGTVQKVFAGTTKAPRWETRMALEMLLGSEELLRLEKNRKPPETTEDIIAGLRAYDETHPPRPREKPVYGRHVVSVSGAVKEAAAPYNSAAAVEAPYTIRDYFDLPDDQRVELIDGVFYDMASPASIHQSILGHLHGQLYPCAENHPECELFLSPSDVRLDNDDYTVVQPDLYIICGRDAEERRQRMVSGAPDFIVEILSPSNREHDLYRKLSKYRFAGVREYWVVDPEKLEVLVHDLEHDELPKTYSFTDTIPVLISDGECAVDFSRIYERIRQYL